MKKDRAPSPHFLKLGEDFDSDFGDIFSGVDKRKSAFMDDNVARPLTLGRVESEPILSNPPKAFSNTERVINPSPPLPPVGYAQRREMNASPPTQWARRNSRDRLMSSPDLESPVDDEPPPPPPKHTTPGKGPKPYAYGLLSEPADMLEEPPRLGHTASLRSQHSFTRSGADEDADAAFVRRSVHALRTSTLELSGGFESSPLARKEMKMSNALAPPTSHPLNSSSDISLKTTSSTSSHINEKNLSSTPQSQGLSPSESTRSTPKVTRAEPAKEEEEMFDPEVMQAIHQANNRSMLGLPTESPSQSPARPSAGSRVMSMAEFNKQKANTWSTAAAPKPGDVDNSDDGYEDDDDDPKIQAQKRRLEAQKEAQHAVWRQKMKKAIGDQSTMPGMRPDFARANHSAPALTFNGEPGPDDEDDDVPLAILQAHNFPGQNKTPDPRMSQQSYTGIQAPGSPGRASVAGQRASQLPVFARRLPEDPYFGASDLNAPTNRESMAFSNRGRAASVYGGASGPPPGVSPVPGVPPGGLVGVIAEEETQRRARRGSPNAQVGMGYNMPGVGPMGGGMPMQMPMGGQNDSVRNQQMLELMQQNSFMMKEMMEMRAQMQLFQMGGPQMPMGPQGMPMPGLPAQSRPMSIADQNSSRRSVAPSTMYGRTMSFMGPAPNMFLNQQVTPGAPTSTARSVRNMPVGNFGPLAGYTPSIAPSERSNIGQPSRYKPVNFGDGGSTITTGSTPKLSQMAEPDKKRSGFLSAVVHSGRKSTSRGKNDEDEEEWGTRRKRR